MQMEIRSTNHQCDTGAKRKWEVPLLIGIVVLAFGLRVTIAVVTTSWVFSHERNFWRFGYEMGQISSSIAMGNGFSWPEWEPSSQGEPTAWMAPAYPYIMAAAFTMFGLFSPQAAKVLILFLTITSVLTCVFLYFIGKRLYNPHVGLLAAFLLAVYPPAIHFAVSNLWEISLFTCSLFLVILLFLRLANQPRVKEGMWLGIAFGFSALVNPIIVGAYPFALVWLYLKAEGGRHTIIKTSAAIIIVSGVVIAPWLVRNYIVFGQFAFIKSNLGNELYLGNNKYSTGGYEDAITSRKNMSKVFTEVDLAFLDQSNEIIRNKFLFRHAVTFIVDHPLRFVQQTMFRFVRYWTYPKPERGLHANISLVIYFILLFLAVAGIILTKLKDKNTQLLLIFLLTLPLPYYFTIVRAFRYRFPIEPILIVFAAYMLYWIACQGKNRFKILPRIIEHHKLD
jgi:4-amino-4-deoxy-L-arabinose transferase-like glycosyltransferase